MLEVSYYGIELWPRRCVTVVIRCAIPAFIVAHITKEQFYTQQIAGRIGIYFD
jgi:hypothetical protein